VGIGVGEAVFVRVIVGIDVSVGRLGWISSLEPQATNTKIIPRN